MRAEPECSVGADMFVAAISDWVWALKINLSHNGLNIWKNSYSHLINYTIIALLNYLY